MQSKLLINEQAWNKAHSVQEKISLVEQGLANLETKIKENQKLKEEIARVRAEKAALTKDLRLKNHNLGVISGVPTKEKILNAFNQVNKSELVLDLDVTVELTNTDLRATISAKNFQKVVGKVEVDFIGDLAALVDYHNFENFDFGWREVPTQEQIKIKLKENNQKNQRLNIDKIIIEAITATSAVIKPLGSDYYTNSKTISFNQTNFRSFVTFQNLGLNKNVSASLATKNKIYLAIDDGRFWFKEKHGTKIETPIGVQGIVTTLSLDRQGRVLVGTKQGKIFQSNDGKQFSLMASLKGAINAVVVDANNTIYAAGDAGKIYKNKQLTNQPNQFTEKNLWPIRTANIKTLAIDNKNNLYVGCASGYFYFSVAGNNCGIHFEQVKLEMRIIESLRWEDINSIVTDTKGNVYVATNDGEIFKGSTNKSYSKIVSANKRYKKIGELNIDTHQNLYFLNADGEVFKKPQDKGEVKATGISKNSVQALTINPDGHLFASKIAATNLEVFVCD